jgi:serine/threonine protein kinase
MTASGLPAGVLSDRYAIERELGRGGMATVCLAKDLRHQRRVAVKVLRPELANSLGPERFRREIEIAASLNHPNILPLLDSGTLPSPPAQNIGRPFYVISYIQGESLRNRLGREKQLPLELARIESARGNQQLAREHYRRFLELYDMPSSRMRHLVDDARAALKSLE